VNVRIAVIVSTPFMENTYIVHEQGNDECVVFDPGLEPEKILRHLADHQLTPAAILCTHGHSDHIAGNAALKDRWPGCPLVIGALDAPKLTDSMLNLSAPFGFDLRSPPADRLVSEGDTCTAAGLCFDVFETPGHSLGHVVFVLRGAAPIHVFGGDVLFRGSVGRTDIPDGDFNQLRSAIHNKLFILPDDTIVFPGHGQTTTIGEEKANNPFVGSRPDGRYAGGDAQAFN
jgi:glyoxylase-like metal-dependent hydrolase (beta-lactamase superfamily II)